MTRTIGIAFVIMTVAGLAVPGAYAETAEPADPHTGSECRKIDRCIPTRDELDGKASREQLIKTRQDTVKNAIRNVR